MKKFKVNNLEEFNDFYKSNAKLKFNYHCQRNGDDYLLRIDACSEEVNNQAMLVFKNVESYTDIKIHIDSQKFMDAYDSLGESEKIPPQHEITNPCSHEWYMKLFIEVSIKDILPLLEEFNGMNDNYPELVKLAVKKRGGIFGRNIGI